MKTLRSISFPLFLSTFVISFYIPILYREIVFLEFMFLGPLVLFSYYRLYNLSQTYLVVCVLFTAVTLLLGVPGSALGYFLSASIGLFVAQYNFESNKKYKTININYFVVTTLFFIGAGYYLLYLNYMNPFSHHLIGHYFGNASLNYASITIASFCSIFSVWCIQRKSAIAYFSVWQDIVLRILSGMLCFVIIATAIIFSTRSAIFGFIPPFLYAIQPKRMYHVAGVILTITIISSVFLTGIYDLIVAFVVPGRVDILDLVSTELVGQQRSQSAAVIFEKAIPSMLMCTDCSDYLSFSGISNLIALSFPLSLFFIYKILSFISGYFLNSYYLMRTNLLAFLIISFSFINSLFLTIFQADFLSMVSLFYVIGVGSLLFRIKLVLKS